jgi:acyl-coenzyme A thioesterase PaaI-like protein
MKYTARQLKKFMENNPPLPNHYSGNCFACVNPKGLKLKFWELDDVVFTKYTIAPRFSGFEGLGHGGIIATLLDEVSAWTIAIKLRDLAVTQNFTLNYLKPVYTRTEVIAEGLIGSHENNHVIVHAHLKNLNDNILVESNSTWTLPGKKMLAKIFRIDLEKLDNIYNTYFDPIDKYLKEKQKAIT